MKSRPEPVDFYSVDWETLSEKRDWPGLAWTAAAVVIILIGFIGGMVFRTSMTGGPNNAEKLTPAAQNAHNDHPAPNIQTTDQYPGS